MCIFLIDFFPQNMKIDLQIFHHPLSMKNLAKIVIIFTFGSQTHVLYCLVSIHRPLSSSLYKNALFTSSCRAWAHDDNILLRPRIRIAKVLFRYMKRLHVGEEEQKAICHLHPNKEGIHGIHLQVTWALLHLNWRTAASIWLLCEASKTEKLKKPLV